MNSTRILFKVILEKKWQAAEKFRTFHVFPNLHRQFKSSLKTDHYLADTSLFLTTLPKKKSGKKSTFKVNKVPSGPLLISCKHNKLNHYAGIKYNSFEEVPLASKGWYHRKSKGDYFTILPAFEHPAFLSSRAEELPKTFTELEVKDEIIEKLQSMGISNPTVIQAKTISILLNGKNVLITAETGCGKTLAYVIPMMQNILNLKQNMTEEVNSPIGVVLLPTKELAVQVGRVVTDLGKDLGLHCVTLVSGDFDNIAKDPSVEVTDVIVSTLGILVRYIKSKIYLLKRCKVLALDEADVFFENEFFPDLKYFFSLAKLNFLGLRNSIQWPNAAQICLSSATSALKLSSNFKNFIPSEHLEIVSTGYLHKVSFHVRQHFMRLNKMEKPQALLAILTANVKKRIPTIVFSNELDTCKFLHTFLMEQGIDSIEINGTMFSDVRMKGYIDFKEGKVLVLICTDCMSRGLDMIWVKQIINYDFPNNMPSYIHRCGRTGRLGHDKNCLVTNFVSGKNEIKFVNEIELAARLGRELTLRREKLPERQLPNKPKKRRWRRMKRKN